MGEWVRCTVKEPFLEGDIIRWTQDVMEKEHPRRARSELIRVGEMEIRAQVEREDENGWVFLKVDTCSVTVDLTKTRRLRPEQKGKTIRRHRGTIMKGRPQRSRASWDQDARESVAETIRQDGGLAMSYNRTSGGRETGR